MSIFCVQKKRGFTLVEILVVCSVVAILATVAYGVLGEARKKARDTERMTELSQIQLALRLYKDEQGSYPDCDDEMVIGEGATRPSGCAVSIDEALSSYISSPSDPMGSGSDTTYEYAYDSDFTCPTVGPNTIILYVKNMEIASNSNWATVCNGGTAPGTNTYAILLQKL